MVSRFNLSPKIKLHPKSPKVFSNGQTLISLFLMPYQMCRVKPNEQGCAKMKELHFKARVDIWFKDQRTNIKKIAYAGLGRCKGLRLG
jgi:hypothetical protein